MDFWRGYWWRPTSRRRCSRGRIGSTAPSTLRTTQRGPIRVEPYEPGRYFVRRADPAKLKPARRGPPVQYDWDEGFQFMRRELDKRGDPVDPINAVKGWRSEADVARLVAAHVAIGRQQPDLKHTERTIRPKLKEWRASKRSVIKYAPLRSIARLQPPEHLENSASTKVGQCWPAEQKVGADPRSPRP